MDMEEIKQLVLRLAAIANQLEMRNVEATRRIEVSAAGLDQGMGRLNAGAELFAQRMTQRVGEGAQQAVAQGLDRAMGQFIQQLQVAGNSAKWAAESMAEQRRLMTAAQRTLVWKGLAALMLGSLLAAGGVGYAGWKSRQALEQSGLAEQFVQAASSGALVKCGQALCVRVGSRPRRAGKERDYVVVDP